MPRTLHLNYRTTLAATLVDWLQDGDSLVLLGDGTYALATLPTELSGRLYVLQEDAQARGLANYLSESALPIDMATLVQLVSEHERSLTWN